MTHLPQLPTETWDMIFQETGLMTLEEAEKVRKDLMTERKFFVDASGAPSFRSIFLCIHWAI